MLAILSDVYDGLRLRTQELIKKTLIERECELLEQIKEVSIDLWREYKTLVTELMPNAQVVADRFHVMTQVNKELDTQIKREKRNIEDLIKKGKLAAQKAEYEEILLGFKNSKYPLLKNEDNFNKEQVDKLIQVKNVSPVLKVIHELKEKIRKIFNKINDWYTGVFKLGIWLSRAKKSCHLH
ncbi:transposase [Nostoc sp. CHAB 5824]|nr:transposase [Nostoc sp. CHAB 5824]